MALRNPGVKADGPARPAGRDGRLPPDSCPSAGLTTLVGASE